jgi:hypothetical protein
LATSFLGDEQFVGTGGNNAIHVIITAQCNATGNNGPACR